jgi:ankyrin repeat protein
MRVDPSILAELKAIATIDEPLGLKNRLRALIVGLEESSRSSTETVASTTVSDIMPPSKLARKLHDVLEQSDSARLMDIIKTTKSVASVILDEVTGVTALHRAVEIGNSEIVEMLMDQIDSETEAAKFLHNLNGEMLVSDLRSKINTRTRLTGYTPLHFAVSSSNDQVVVELLRRGGDADLRSLDDQEISPFLLACELGQDVAVRVMIKASQGRCVDSTDVQGNTALHLAAENGHGNIVQVLMSVMPQLSREENKDGKTAADLASDSKRDEIAKLIDDLARNVGRESSERGGLFFG